jgi:hypothetical protein
VEIFKFIVPQGERDWLLFFGVQVLQHLIPNLYSCATFERAFKSVPLINDHFVVEASTRRYSLKIYNF